MSQSVKQTKQHSYLEYMVQEFQQPYPVTEKEIYEINRSLKWKNSCGYDDVPSKIVKLSMPLISSPLIHICNRKLFTGTLPTCLKFSQILPILKKGNRAEISAYRPLSLLRSFSKIFQKVIFNRLLQHTKGNNIITSDQNGFKKNSSTEVAIFNVTKQILSQINSFVEFSVT
jgi:Notch-like protein